MGKRGFALFVMLFSLFSIKAALAQDIVIAGKNYPLIILIPFAIVVIAWAVILIIWAARRIHKFSLILFNIGQMLSRLGAKLGIGGMKERMASLKLRKAKAEEKAKEKPEEKKEPIAKKDLTPFLDKVEEIEGQLPKLKEAATFKNLNSVIRSFFSTLFNLQYEFTDQELMEVLEKKKKSLIEFSQKLSDYKYSGKEMKKEDLVKLIDDFKRIVQQYVKAGYRAKKVSRGAIETIVEQDKKILANIRGYLEFLRTENKKKQIQKMLEDERKVLSDNVRSIKRRYNKILKLYVQLSPAEKAVVYPALVGFYENVNKAIFSSVYSEKSKKQLEYFVRELTRLKKMPKRESLFSKLKKAFRPKPLPKVRVEAEEPFASRLKKAFSVLKGARLIRARPKPVPEPVEKPKAKPEKVPKPVPMPEPVPSMEPVLKKLTNVFKPFPTKEVKLPAKAAKPKVAVKVAEKKKVMPPPDEKAIMEQLDRVMDAYRIERVDYMAKVRDLVAKGMRSLKGNRLEIAEKCYSELRFSYANLDKKEQKKAYDSVIKLFNAIKAARRYRREQVRRKQEAEERKRLLEERKKLEVLEKERIAKKEKRMKMRKLEREEERLVAEMGRTEQLELIRQRMSRKLKRREKAEEELKAKEELERKKLKKEAAKQRKVTLKNLKGLETEKLKLMDELDRLKEEL